MAHAQVIKRFADLTGTPWANGGGSTTELVSFEESASFGDGPAWRLSIAELAESGPFSPLPGVWRTFAPLGATVRLSVDGVVHTITSGHALEFSGASEIELIALSRPCAAVNLMTRATTRPRIGLRLATAAPEGEAVVSVVLTAASGIARFDLVRGTGHPAVPASAPRAIVVRKT